jgi:hypothetical protein
MIRVTLTQGSEFIEDIGIIAVPRLSLSILRCSTKRKCAFEKLSYPTKPH